jgi:hypothetical protein
MADELIVELLRLVEDQCARFRAPFAQSHFPGSGLAWTYNNRRILLNMVYEITIVHPPTALKSHPRLLDRKHDKTRVPRRARARL